jgi:predicted CopG family antitoxin
LANFHISVPEELYDWLVKERKKHKASSVQDVIRQVLRKAKAEAEKHG